MTDAVRDTGNVSRRAALRLVGGSVASLLAPPSLAAVRDHAVGQRSLSLYNRHTGERKAVTYWGDGNYKPRALEEIDVLLRDLRTDETIRTDVGLLDYLYLLHEKLETTEPFHVICGYRSPATNSALARRTSSVAWNSLHVEGRAIDIRLPGRRLRDVRRAALDLRIGGVGYYPRDNFLHIDTGAVRSW